MNGLTSEQLLSVLRTAQWSADVIAQLREWVTGIRDSGERFWRSDL